ncbi:helix-turn-helix domain-containing protein [bacterium]|nr:helix-turn-helix domain-containing protein [bacterium]
MSGKHSDNKKRFYLLIDKISPQVRFVGEYTAKPNWEQRPRILYDHLIEYIYDGKGLYTIGDKKFQVSRGDLVLIPPGVIHSMKSDSERPFVRQCVHFDFNYVGGYDSMPAWEWVPHKLQAEKVHPTPIFSEELNLPPVSHMLHVPKIRPLFCRLFREMYHKAPGYKLAVKACMLDIILLIHRNALLGDTNSADEPVLVLSKAVVEAKKFMEINFNERLTLSEIAEVAKYHPVYFERLFKKFMGCSPIEYLLEVRISKAKEFLEHSDLNISEIATEVGFESVQYFSLAFKKLVGISPRHYRRLIQNSGDAGICLPPGYLKDYPTHELFTSAPTENLKSHLKAVEKEKSFITKL